MFHKDNCQLAARARQQLGHHAKVGDTARIHSNLASSIKAHHTWDPRKSVNDTDHGGVFNFDFSRNGSLLGVACERKSVLLFDPFNGKLVASKTNAHTDCVNCVKFLDDRLFATCSDDTTVALWDTRYLKHNVKTFHGHSNWVKNIEYDANLGLLITSGFDGCIYTWNINRYSDEESSNKVFYTSGLMRSKLSPDFSKLLISTHEGYIIVIHNLDLSTLGDDLKGFKPNMYRLMQRSQTPLRIGLMYNHVFEQERNRVEFIADWPTGNDANIISSLQIHPQGWCVLSRNTDSTENAEWTCVHDIQDSKREKKREAPPWEVETPHTSSSYCSSTNTPAFSSVAPSNLRNLYQSTSTNQNSPSCDTSNSLTNQNTQNTESTNESSSSVNSLANQNSPNSTSAHHQDSQSDSPEGSESSASCNTSPSSNQEVGLNTNNQTSVNVNESVSSVDHTRNSSNASETEENGNDSDSSNEEALQPRVQIIRGSHNPPAIDQNATPAVGRLHDSLIQIRRGSRNEDGHFSFSISVHTASGRTIEFNQADLESDEDDEFAIEQIMSSADPNFDINSQSVIRPRQNASGSAEPNHEENNDNESDVDDIVSDNNNGDNGNLGGGGSALDEHEESVEANNLEQDERESDPDYVPGNEGDYDSFVDGSDDDDVFPGDRASSELPSSMAEEFYRAAVGFNSPDEGDDEIDDLQRARENLRQAYRLGTRNSDERLRRSREESQQIDSRRNTEDQSRSVNTNLNTTNPVAANPLDSRPRTNTFMFVLQSNSGDRRRRILNLSYMDSYSERENSLLQKKIHSNKKRLLGYVEECNVGRGFIKELAFSSDGRLVSSPFGFGLRIFAFDSDCNELCNCLPTSPVKLYEVTCSLAHGNCVVATKFSPTHNMVVSGCLDGKIAFHQPVF